MESGSTNLTLDGKPTKHQNRKGLPTGIANRVILQGKYAESFIDFSQTAEKPFFLYLPLYGPHVPLIKKSDPYYKKFPKLDYPHGTIRPIQSRMTPALAQARGPMTEAGIHVRKTAKHSGQRQEEWRKHGLMVEADRVHLP